MRLIVVSDIHGRKGNLFEIVDRHIKEADYFLCLGDCNSGDDFEIFCDSEKFQAVAML